MKTGKNNSKIRKLEREIKKLESSKKRVDIAFLCAFLFGGFDFLYIKGDITKFILYYLVGVISFWFMLIPISIWWIVNLCTVKSRVEKYNEKIESRIQEIENQIDILESK